MRKVGKRKQPKVDKKPQEYVLVAGYHREGTGADTVEYEPGDTITTDKPYDKMFANKWVPVDRKKLRRPTDRDDTLDESGRVMDRPLGSLGEDEEGDEGDINVLKTKGKKDKQPRPEMKKTNPTDVYYDDEEDEDEKKPKKGLKGREEDSEEDAEDETEEKKPKTIKVKKKKGKHKED